MALSLAPSSPGRRTLTAITATLATLVLLSGCGGEGQTQTQGHGPGARNGQRAEQPPVPVATTPATVGSIASTYSANATLEAEAEAEILARVSGVVQKIFHEEGDRVREGDVLLQIEAGEYRYRLEQARATTANLQSQYDRQADMVERGLVSQEAFDTAESQLANAKAAEGLAELELSYTTVRSPFTGRVVQRLVDPGQNVSVGSPLFRVADFDPLLARVHVPSKEFRRLSVDQPVSLFLDSDGTRLEGHIKLVSPIIDPNSGTIKVTIEIPEYPEGVRPGDFAEVRIVTERRDGRVLVPRNALVSDKGEDVVYVVGEGVAERRAVEVGLTDDDFAEIVSGVREGEPVVIKGQRSLRHGQKVKILGGGAGPSEASETANAGNAGTKPGRGQRKGA